MASAITLTQGTVISYVQGNYATPQSLQTSVSVTFAAAQVAGDLNVVVVGWNDGTATVNSVMDTVGNVYTRAVGPTVIAGVESQSVYYAKNIAAAAAGANSITVSFSSAAAFPDIRILEYSGADLNNPVDVTAANSGNSGTSSSGSVTTTDPIDLLFGANIVQTTTSGPGAGFTSRLLTSPDGDIAEDLMVTTVGSYSATAPLSSGQWIMQMVAFRAALSGPAPLVNLSSTSINFGSQATGGTSNAQSVTLTNVGTAQLVITSIGIAGGNVSDFGQTNNCPATLIPNASCTISVTFTPSTTGARASAVTITDNASNSPQTIVLSGMGTGFSVSPSVTALTFTRTQQFNASSGGVTWSVDGVVGGTGSSGTITVGGLYTPPASIGTHTVTATTSTQSASATVYITNYPGTFTFHNDNLRTGQNLNETILTPANVNWGQFGKLFSYTTDGISHASPLYVANVNIPSQGSHNVVYVATEHNSIFAFDADGLSTTPLWQVSFINPSAGITTVPAADTGETGDIAPEIGITGTPVIDPNTGTLYVVVKTKEVSGNTTSYIQRLHAVDITTGAERLGSPVVIQASVTGSGAGSSGGHLAFDSLRENQRPALLLNNGVIYLAFASHGDQAPYHGWVLGYNATSLQQVMAYCDSPNGAQGGIWQSGLGLAADATGNVFFMTGNGTFDADTGGLEYGDSIVRLAPGGTILDYFTPHDQNVMNSNNWDLSSSGPMLLPDQPGAVPHLLVAAGKTGTLYLVNRDSMGHYNSSNDNQIVQSLINIFPNGTPEPGNYSAPVYFNGSVYFSPINDTIKAFGLNSGLLTTSPTSVSSVIYPYPGGWIALSANGNTNGILWAIQRNDAGTADPGTTAPGVLRAYLANNLGTELYNSSQAGARDTLDYAAKFTVPLVANGKVFVLTNGRLTAFGLLP